ncbi:MAG: ATP-binding cassette domain-containing protein [Oscillospiraceae bacterium]
MEYLLETNDLTKQYGKHKAADSINIHIRQGEIYGLIGRNGAGKSTVLKILSGLSSPTSGDFSLFGMSGKQVSSVMHRVGSLIESPGLYPEMTAYENVRIKCMAMGIRNKNAANELLELTGIADTGRKPVKKFSLGMKQRLGIALALAGEPDLIILDEPINGLDPQGIAEVRSMIERLNREKGITFIISSHILEELSKIATSYGMIHNGQLLCELTREELMEKCRERIELKTDDTARACTVIEEMGINNYKVADSDTIHIFERTDDTGNITMKLSENGVKTLGIAVKAEALEDFYLELTGGNANV